MAITTRDGLVAAVAAAQRIEMVRTAVRTSVAAIPFSVFDLAGSPGAGVLAGSNTANGLVPTDATTGCPVITAFTGANTGYVTRLEASNTVSCRVALYDCLFKAGAYAFNAATTLASQPSYSGRDPSGVYNNTELWLECVTAFTGNQSIRVEYLDQGGAAGDTGTIATGIAPIVGRMLRLPLAAGDTGISRVNVVTSTISTVGTFNVLVLRRLGEARVRVANDQIVQGFDLTGIPKVYADSALMMLVRADSTSTGLPELVVDVANG